MTEREGESKGRVEKNAEGIHFHFLPLIHIIKSWLDIMLTVSFHLLNCRNQQSFSSSWKIWYALGNDEKKKTKLRQIKEFSTGINHRIAITQITATSFIMQFLFLYFYV